MKRRRRGTDEDTDVMWRRRMMVLSSNNDFRHDRTRCIIVGGQGHSVGVNVFLGSTSYPHTSRTKIRLLFFFSCIGFFSPGPSFFLPSPTSFPLFPLLSLVMSVFLPLPPSHTHSFSYYYYPPLFPYRKCEKGTRGTSDLLSPSPILLLLPPMFHPLM